MSLTLTDTRAEPQSVATAATPDHRASQVESLTPANTPKRAERAPAWTREADPEIPTPMVRRLAVTEKNATSELDRYKLSLRKFDPVHKGLPWRMQSQCEQCGTMSDAVLDHDEAGGKFVMLNRECPKCGPVRTAHHDALFDKTRVHDHPESPRRTYRGHRINPIVRELPRTIETLCPDCSCNVLGRYYAYDGAVWLEKTCPEHGYFRDKISANVELYLKTAYWSFEEPQGIQNPQVLGAAHCPSDCGLCNQHQSTAVLANIDLTNRCDLTCPVCFANANIQRHISEPSFDEVVLLLRQLRDQRPTPCTAVQFSGGEPTLHTRFHDIVRKAAEMGFSHIQIATNGITHADPEFAKRSREAGLHTLYLQFDGVDDHVYEYTRGEPLMDKKLRCIENCRKVGLKVCLVPTIVKGFNDDQVPKIFEFAVKNIDAISAISYQPVVFTGRISKRDLEEKRYTLGDMANTMKDAGICEPLRDFFPLSMVVPLSKIVQALTKQPKIRSSCHTDCAAGTYFVVSRKTGKAYPFTSFFDIPKLFSQLNDLANELEKKPKVTLWDKLRVLWLFYRNFDAKKAPPDLGVMTFIKALQGLLDKNKGRGKADSGNYRTLMAAGMHFMDRYNYDVERVKRCVIHYSTPDGIYPFCTYNSGPTYRPYIEKMYSVGKAEWKTANPGIGLMEPGSMARGLPDRVPAHLAKDGKGFGGLIALNLLAEKKMMDMGTAFAGGCGSGGGGCGTGGKNTAVGSSAMPFFAPGKAGAAVVGLVEPGSEDVEQIQAVPPVPFGGVHAHGRKSILIANQMAAENGVSFAIGQAG